MGALAVDGGGRTAEDLRVLAGRLDRHAEVIDVLIQPVVGASDIGTHWAGPHRTRFNEDVVTWVRRHGHTARALRATAVTIRRQANAMEEAELQALRARQAAAEKEDD